VKRPCLDCRKLFTVEGPKQSRCPSCASADRRHKQPRTSEPWRFLYKLPEWRKARARVIRRDGTCRALIHFDGFRRCQATADLEVHHDPPLEQLWKMAAGDRDLFVALATDERKLYALCRSHHAAADADRRTRSGDAGLRPSDDN